MKKQLRRVLVLLLAFTMCFGSAITLFAADAEVTCPGSGKVHTKDNCKYTVEKVQEPLCGKDGYTLYACDTCHAHFIDDVKKALNTCSEFKFVATVEATCKTAGVLAHEECVVCGKVRFNGELLDDAKAKTDLAIPKTANHVWGEWKSTADGKGQTRQCTVCGDYDKEGAHTHNYVIVSVEEAPDATMDKPGKATAKCSECDATAVVDVYPKHECKDYLTKIAKKDATCTAEGVEETYYVCKCGKAYKDAEAKTIMTAEEVAENIIEKHHGSIVPAITEATCIKYGMVGKVCSKCGAQVGETEVIAPTGHKYLTYPADVKDEKGNVIHKKGDVIVNYTRMYNPTGGADGKGEWITYDAATCKDTWKLEETRYCVNVAADSDDKYSAYRTYETADTNVAANDELTVKDADGTATKVKFASAVSAKAITTEVAEKGHTAVKYTTPADCEHGAFTFWYCTNEKCSLEAVSTVEYEWTLNGKTSEVETVKKNYRTVDRNYNPLKVISNAKGTEWSVATKNELSSNKTISLTTTDGKTVYKQKEAVEGENHVVWTKNNNNSKDATCMTTGLMAGTCVCGKEVKVVLDKLAHVYELKDENKPTCKKTGKYTCTTSGCAAYITIPTLTFTPVTGVLANKAESDAKAEAEGHTTTTTTTKDATCTTDAITTVTCTVCKKTWSYVSKAATGHTKPEKIDEGSAGGYVLKKSSDGTKVEAYPEPESYKFVTTGAVTKNTSVKGVNVGTASGIKANTEIKDGSAINVLKTLTDAQLAALNIKRVRTPAKSAAYFCKTCDEFVASTTANGTINENTINEKTYIDGHEVSAQITTGTAATHGSTGYKANSYGCAICNEYGATTAYIDEDGNSTVIYNLHTLTKVAAVKPTCTTDGNKEYYTCSGCKTLFKDQYGMEEYTSKSETVEGALGHLYLDENGNRVGVIGGHSDNDCSTADYVFYRCMRVTKKNAKDEAIAWCGAEYIGDYVAAQEHELVDVAAKAPTCNTDGYTAHKACKHIVGTDENGKPIYCTYTEGKEVVPATGHKDAKGVFYDCNMNGRKCLNAKCDYYMNGNSYIAVSGRKKTMEGSNGHNIVEGNTNIKTETVAETCTTDGYTVVSCTKCGEILSVAIGKKALGHAMVQKDEKLDGNVYVAPTSLTEGRATFVCAHTWTENGKTVSCDYTEVRTLPKKSDLKLDISVDNAVVKGAEIVESGKVKVTVSLSATHADVWGANFVVGYDADILSFVGAEDISDNFIVTGNAQTAVKTENKKNVTYETGEVWVLVEAENDAEGNAQNITIEGSEALVDIYFTVVGDAKYDENDKLVASDLTFKKASAGDKDSKTVEINKEAKASAAVKYIADVDGNKEVNVNDLSALLKLMRSEKYSAAADLDKDGEITAIDYALLANYLSGFASMKDIRNATAE